MKIGRKLLTLTALATLSAGSLFAQGTVPKPAKPSNSHMASKMAEEPPTSQSGKKELGKKVHGHHHNKNKKHSSSTPTQDTTTKK